MFVGPLAVDAAVYTPTQIRTAFGIGNCATTIKFGNTSAVARVDGNTGEIDPGVSAGVGYDHTSRRATHNVGARLPGTPAIHPQRSTPDRDD